MDLNLTGIAVLAVIVGAATARDYLIDLRRRIRDWHQPDPLDQLQADYAAGRIDHDEFADRVEAHLSADDEYTRERLAEIPGIGPTIAAELAVRFESVEHVRLASRERLTAVPDVGPQRAEAIREWFEAGGE
jgi:ERCC4-type nuclease